MGRKQVPWREVDRSSAPLALPRPAHSMFTTATQLWTGRARHCRRMHSAPTSLMDMSLAANRVMSPPAKRASRAPMMDAPIMAVRAAKR